MKILSIHFTTHDTGVALVEDGEVKFAVANERFSRRKMDKGVPLMALNACFSYLRLKPENIDQIVFVGRSGFSGFKDFLVDSLRPMWLTRGRFIFWFKNPIEIVKWFFICLGIPSYIKRQLIPELLIRFYLRKYKGKIVYVPHHFSHVASAYYSSGWNDCLVGVIEGDGYAQTMSFWNVRNGVFDLITETKMPHSAGKFYELITMMLGFNKLRHAGKITGLAAYGNSQSAYKDIKQLMWVEGLELKLDYITHYRWIAEYSATSKIPKKMSKYSREDLAAAFQKRLEECIVEIVKKVAVKTGQSRIALAGGVVANVKLNQKIHELDEIKELYVHQAMGDDGLAVGASLHIAFKSGEDIKKIKNVYLGPDFTDQEIVKSLKKYRVLYTKEKNIEKRVAELIAEGKVIARFNGRVEYGPRALGNRSILYQTTDKSVNDWLNKRLKRTEFMPFAPVTLDKYADKCYKNLKGAEYAARFMTITFECTEYMKKISPAVVHIDGTARPQIIRKEDNISYYEILEEYYKLTGIPSLVNTSFNMHEEPIVCSPDDALRAFLSGDLDNLAIGGYLVAKRVESEKWV